MKSQTNQVRTDKYPNADFFDWLDDAEGFVQYVLDNLDALQDKHGDATALMIIDVLVHDLAGFWVDDKSMLPKATGYGKYKRTRVKKDVEYDI